MDLLLENVIKHLLIWHWARKYTPPKLSSKIHYREMEKRSKYQKRGDFFNKPPKGSCL